MKYLTIITARSGSKRLPDKNILKLADRPLIEWTYIVAKDLKIDHTVVVSTNCSTSRKLALEFGFICDELRPDNLSQDHTSSEEVINYEISKAIRNKVEFDSILLLQPTSPLRTSGHILQAIKIFESGNCDAVQSYTLCESPLEKIFQINQHQLVKNIYESIGNCFPKGTYHHTNGAIYLIKKDVFLQAQTFIPKKSKAYLMDRKDSIDIDEQLDFEIAEFLMRKNRLQVS